MFDTLQCTVVDLQYVCLKKINPSIVQSFLRACVCVDSCFLYARVWVIVVNMTDVKSQFQKAPYGECFGWHMYKRCLKPRCEYRHTGLKTIDVSVSTVPARLCEIKTKDQHKKRVSLRIVSAHGVVTPWAERWKHANELAIKRISKVEAAKVAIESTTRASSRPEVELSEDELKTQRLIESLSQSSSSSPLF